jgi:hypothetical protein
MVYQHQYHFNALPRMNAAAELMVMGSYNLKGNNSIDYKRLAQVQPRPRI